MRVHSRTPYHTTPPFHPVRFLKRADTNGRDAGAGEHSGATKGQVRGLRQQLLQDTQAHARESETTRQKFRSRIREWGATGRQHVLTRIQTMQQKGCDEKGGI